MIISVIAICLSIFANQGFAYSDFEPSQEKREIEKDVATADELVSRNRNVPDVVRYKNLLSALLHYYYACALSNFSRTDICQKVVTGSNTYFIGMDSVKEDIGDILFYEDKILIDKYACLVKLKKRTFDESSPDIFKFETCVKYIYDSVTYDSILIKIYEEYLRFFIDRVDKCIKESAKLATSTANKIIELSKDHCRKSNISKKQKPDTICKESEEKIKEMSLILEKMYGAHECNNAVDL